MKRREVLLSHDLCSNCGICMATKSLDLCPQVNIPDELYESDPLGQPRAVVLAQSRIKELLERAQDGGTVTTLAHVALDSNIVKYVLGCRLGKGEVVSLPEVVERSEDVVKICGSKYTYTPVLAALSRVDVSKGVCVTGVPCQIRATKLFEEKHNANLLKIGILCSSNFKRELILNILKSSGKRVEDIVRMEVKRKFRVLFRDGNIVEISISEAKKYTCNCCRQCPELVPRLSDIAVGSMFLPEKWNIVFVYSRRGEELIDMAVKRGLLEVKDAPQEVVSKIRDFALRKQRESRKFREEFLRVISEIR